MYVHVLLTRTTYTISTYSFATFWDNWVPDAEHGLLDAWNGIVLVPVQSGYEAGEVWLQLVPGLCCYTSYAKRRTLPRTMVTDTKYVYMLFKKTFLEFQSALWLARFINLYTRSGWFMSLANEHSSLYVDSADLAGTEYSALYM